MCIRDRVQMIEIGGTLGSDVNLGQETGGGNLACLGTGAVSYTHLDVYKRQDYY